MSEQKVIFIHIPKTAGTSVYYNFYSQYPMLGFFHFLDHQHGDLTRVGDDFRIKDYNKLPGWLKKRTQAHAGHMPFGFHQSLDEGYKYVTFIRKPFDRIRSNYLHMRYHKHHPSHQLIHRENIALKDFVEDERFQDGKNFMTRILSGTFQHVKVEKHHFDQALQNIESSDMFVGLQEEFENSLLLLADELQWKRPLVITRANEGKLDLMEDDLDLRNWIEEQNEWDIKLHDTLKAAYERKWNQRKKTIQSSGPITRSLSKKIKYERWLKSKVVRYYNFRIAQKSR